MEGDLPSWKLLAGCSAFTDLPNSVLHLWRLHDASALYKGKAYFEGSVDQPLHDTLIESSTAPQMQLLEAMPYDPEWKPEGSTPKPPSKDGRFYFLWVELTLLPGAAKRATFSKAAHALLTTMKTKLPTWKLIAAGSTVTGPPNTVMHLWQLDDANALLEGMNWFGENNEAYSELAGCCVRQRQQLLTSMFYNPLGTNGVSAEDATDATTMKKIRQRSQAKLQGTKETK
jgi:hypothetical protein